MGELVSVKGSRKTGRYEEEGSDGKIELEI